MSRLPIRKWRNLDTGMVRLFMGKPKRGRWEPILDLATAERMIRIAALQEQGGGE